MASRVFLHVGTPKTGTTFLQEVLWSQLEQVRSQGLLMPGSAFQDHYLACMDVVGNYEKAPRAVVRGRRWSATVPRGVVTS